MLQTTQLIEFFSEIQTLTITISDDPSKHQIVGFAPCPPRLDWLEPGIKRVKESALNELLFLPKEQIQFSLNRLQILRSDLKTIIDTCQAKFYDNSEEELLKWLSRTISKAFFIDISYDKLVLLFEARSGRDTGRILFEFANAVGFKLALIADFIKNVFRVTGLKPELHESEMVAIEDELLTRNPFTAYIWLDKNPAESLSDLFGCLYHEYVVDTDEKDFFASFTGAAIGSFKPIKWNGNASELLYFIFSLMPGLLNDERQRMNWQRLKACFVKADGQPFTEDFKSLKGRLETNLAQLKRERIDVIVKQNL